MGACLSHSSTTALEKADATSDSSIEPTSDAHLETFVLKKKRPGCTGMFWRPDPTGKTVLMGNSNWPRDNAVIRGEVIHHKGQKWLRADRVQQARGGKWKKAPEGACMPFEYNNHYYLDPL